MSRLHCLRWMARGFILYWRACAEHALEIERERVDPSVFNVPQYRMDYYR